MAKAKTVIRKYGNRRMYDTASSRYVNIDDIARLVRDGADVKVVDARTGEDITRVILTQIIMERVKDPEGGLPLGLLHQMVVASDRITHEFLSWYLDTAMELYHRAEATVRSGVAGARQAVASPLEFVRGLLAPQSDAAELERLRRRVDELEARLAELARGRKNAEPRRPGN